MRFTLEVDVDEVAGVPRAQVAWADDGELLAVCEAGMAADALAGATAALTSMVGRIEVAKGIRRGAGQIADALPADARRVEELMSMMAHALGITRSDDIDEPPTPDSNPPAA